MRNRILHRSPLVILIVLLSACAAYRGPTVDDGGITFMVKAPEAASVSIVGSFNRWDPEAGRLAAADRKGWWSITLSLEPGRHEYLFLLDGKDWRLDPNVQFRADDGFGSENSALYVALHAGRPAEDTFSEQKGVTAGRGPPGMTGNAGPSNFREARAAGIPAEDIAALSRRGAARGVNAQILRQFLALGISAERHGLPARPVLDTIEQGLTKERSPDEIRGAAQTVKASLVSAGTLIDEALKNAGRQEGTPERRAGAEAVARVLRAGVTSRDVTELSRLAFNNNVPLSRFTRSMESIAKLHEAGMPENLMVVTARHFIVQNFSEQMTARKELEFFFLIHKGVSWENSFACIHQGFFGVKCGWSTLD